MVKFKQKGVWLILVELLILVGLSANVFARTAPGTVLPAPPKLMSQKYLDKNAWYIYTTNYGPFVNPQQNSGGFWRTPSQGYIFGAGMYVGAIDDQGNKVVAVGYNPNSGGYEFGPASADDTWQNYLSDPLARVFLSDDGADAAAWPIRNELDKPIIKSLQDSYCKYSDENPQFTTSGDKILGVVIEQFTYAWNYADNNDIVFFYFKVKNKSTMTLNNVYIGPCNDCDIGDEATGNDLTGFDYMRNLALQWQNSGEPGWDKTGVVGFRYFESPINNTGDTVTVYDNEFRHTIAPDSSLGMTAFKIFTIEVDPSTDEDRYLMMTGVNYLDLTRDAYDANGADAPGDKRFLMSSGPFILKPDSISTTCIGVIGALDTLALKVSSDIAQGIYDNDFQLATPPKAPTLTATSGDKYVLLSWDQKAETTPDPYWENITDTMGWYTYYPGTWTWLMPSAKLLVDSFEVKIDSAHTFLIKRGDVNPYYDTLRAHYSQRSLYVQYDFQGYLVYRARTLTDLADPAKREHVGTLNVNLNTGLVDSTLSYSGGSGYFYDKVDGIQIVRDMAENVIMTPDSNIYIAKYDTLGSDRGLIYTLVDSNVVNGFGWYYGVSAYDYQNYVCFTRKCPTTLISNPTENVVYGVARTPTVDIKPASILLTTSGVSDLEHRGTVDYYYQLTSIPAEINNDTFYLKWRPINKVINPTNNEIYPQYNAELHDMQIDSSGAVVDTILKTLKLSPQYSIVGTDVNASFVGTFPDEVPFGGVVFNPYISFKPWLANAESLELAEYSGGTRVYPLDSIWSQVYGHVNFGILAGMWQWRGSDYEIRWRDTIVSTRNCLTATVWDITNNVMVPLEYGVSKKNMTKSSWCFNPLATTCTNYIDSSATSAYGMYICGTTIYFNKRNNGTLRRMVWPSRPDSGDVWVVRSTGAGVPSDGEVVSFITIKSSQVANLSSDLLNAVKVVPNPYLVRHNWDVSKNYPNIHFTHLPAKCTIRIFNLAGDLIRVIKHESNGIDNDGTEKWDMLSSYDKRAASGVYIYQVDAPGIGTKLGKFAVIK